MLKERQRYGVAATTSRPRRGPAQNSSSRSTVVAPPEVGIIPANRFFLLPLKKVTALVKPYTPCRDSSATSTKPCIIAKSTAAAVTKQAPINGDSLLQQHSVRHQAQSKRLIVKHRHRHSLVARSPHSTVSLQQLHPVPESEPLLWNNSNIFPSRINTRSFNTVVVIDPAAATNRSTSTSVFTLNESVRVESCREAQATPLAIREFGDYSTVEKMKKKKKKKKKKKQMPSILFYNATSITDSPKKKQKPLNSFYNASSTDLLRYSHAKIRVRHSSTSTESSKDRTSSAVRSFGRNNRVSPSSCVDDRSHTSTFATNFDTRGDSATTPCNTSINTSNTSNKSNTSYMGNKSNYKSSKSSKSRNRSWKGRCSAVLLQKIQSSSPFLCSFTNEKDLPVVGPAPLHLRRLPAKVPEAPVVVPAVPAAAPVEVSVSSGGIRAGFGIQNFLDL